MSVAQRRKLGRLMDALENARMDLYDAPMGLRDDALSRLSEARKDIVAFVEGLQKP